MIQATVAIYPLQQESYEAVQRNLPMIDPQTYFDAGLTLHGHKCPAMPLGLRAGAAAMNASQVERLTWPCPC